MIEQFTSATFAPLVGDEFVATPGDGRPVVLVLADCVETRYGSPEHWRTAARVPFSLVFRAPGGEIIPQQTCLVTHAGLGEFPLFLVPLGGDGSGAMRHEAVFS